MSQISQIKRMNLRGQGLLHKIQLIRYLNPPSLRKQQKDLTKKTPLLFQIQDLESGQLVSRQESIREGLQSQVEKDTQDCLEFAHRDYRVVPAVEQVQPNMLSSQKLIQQSCHKDMVVLLLTRVIMLIRKARRQFQIPLQTKNFLCGWG